MSGAKKNRPRRKKKGGRRQLKKRGGVALFFNYDLFNGNYRENPQHLERLTSHDTFYCDKCGKNCKNKHHYKITSFLFNEYVHCTLLYSAQNKRITNTKGPKIIRTFLLFIFSLL